MACLRTLKLALSVAVAIRPTSCSNDVLGRHLRGANITESAATEAQEGSGTEVGNFSKAAALAVEPVLPSVKKVPQQAMQNLTLPFGNSSIGSPLNEMAWCPNGCWPCGDGWGMQCCCYHCFPGEAEVLVRSAAHKPGVGIPVAELKIGEQVLAEAVDRTLKFEPVLGFLHFAPEARGKFRVAVHERGQFRATSEHLVFVMDAQGRRIDVPMKDIRVGDQLLTALDAADAEAPSSRVLAVQDAEALPRALAGMFAPLTASGTVVVDGVVASVYAGAAVYRSAPHGAYHALFFPVRALALVSRVVRRLGGGESALERRPDELHPAARLFQRMLGPLFLAK